MKQFTDSEPEPDTELIYYITPDNIAIFSYESKSEPGNFNRPVVNLENGLVSCSCKGWDCVKHPLARKEGVPMPDISDIRYHCGCLKKAIAELIKDKEIVLTLRSWVVPPHEGRIYDQEYQKMTGVPRPKENNVYSGSY